MNLRLVSHTALAISILPLFSIGIRAGSEEGIRWTAYSRTAKGITGDVTVSPSAVAFEDGHQLRLIFVGESRGVTLEPDDPPAKLYRIETAKPRDPQTSYEICGTPLHAVFLAITERDVNSYEMMMMGVAKGQRLRTLVLTALIGPTVPDAHTDKDRICGTFGYIRAVN